MPYTIDELQTLDFYNGFRNNLRAQHIDELIIYALNRFRDSEGVLYSFEAIERDPELGIGMGIENSELLKTQEGPYTRLPLELSKEILLESNIDTDYDIVKGYSDDYELFVRESSQSLQRQNSYPEYDREILNSVVNRQFEELITLSIAENLPTGIQNGDVLTRTDALDFRKWLVNGNQKRIFASTASFYGENFNYSDIKAVSDRVLDDIPDGEPVE